MSLRNLLSFDLLALSFLSLSKELIIDYLIKNAGNVENASKKARLKMLKNANLFRWAIRTSSKYFKAMIELKDSRPRMLLR